MIEINLLPEEMRRRKGPQFNFNLEPGNIKIIAGSAVAGILILLIVFLSLGSVIRKGQTRGLLAKEQAITAQTTDIEAINSEISILRARMSVLAQIAKRRFLWAEKLNDLSGLMLPGIWLTRIYTDSQDRLVIEGSVISKKEEAMASVGKFMKNIREDDSFFRDFSDVKLESVQRKNTDERDVVDFNIALYFRSSNGS